MAASIDLLLLHNVFFDIINFVKNLITTLIRLNRTDIGTSYTMVHCSIIYFKLEQKIYIEGRNPGIFFVSDDTYHHSYSLFVAIAYVCRLLIMLAMYTHMYGYIWCGDSLPDP